MTKFSFAGVVFPESAIKFIEANPAYTKKWVKRFPGSLTEAYMMGRVQADWEKLSSHLPKSVKSILDIGGGIGGFSLACANAFPTAKLTLIDQARRTQGENQFPLLAISKEFLLANEIDLARLQFFDSESQSYLESAEAFDLVVSLRALAYSFPYDVYASFLQKRLAQGGYLICDVATWEQDTAPSRAMHGDPIVGKRFESKDSSARVIEQISRSLGPVTEIRRGADSIRIAVRRTKP